MLWYPFIKGRRMCELNEINSINLISCILCNWRWNPWTGMDFPFEIQNKQLASYLCLIIAGIILIAFYISSAKNKYRARD